VARGDGDHLFRVGEDNAFLALVNLCFAQFFCITLYLCRRLCHSHDFDNSPGNTLVQLALCGNRHKVAEFRKRRQGAVRG
jgi:hypothetical protein